MSLLSSLLHRDTYEYVAHGNTLEQLVQRTKTRLEAGYFDKYKESSFKFKVEPFAFSMSMRERLSMINTFSFLPFNGPVEMTSPKVTFSILIKGTSEQWPESGHEMFYLCRHVSRRSNSSRS